MIYDVCITLLCFFQLQDMSIDCPKILEISSDDFKDTIDRCLYNISEIQNENGSWSSDFDDPGAVSLAIRTLQRKSLNFESNIRKGIEWLINKQEKDEKEIGGWKNKSVQQSINKTCDALQGLIVGKKLNLDPDINKNIDHAVNWLFSKEEPIFEDIQTIGWGWQGEENHVTLENSCLTLTTLLSLEDKDVFLPYLVNNVEWLIKQQRNDDSHNGEWDDGLTSRVAYALIKFYGKIKDDSLFN